MSKVKDIVVEVFENHMDDGGILDLPLEKIAEELTGELEELILYTTFDNLDTLF